eukprot:4293086-Pyramimonas_sp.AAC.1
MGRRGKPLPEVEGGGWKRMLPKLTDALKVWWGSVRPVAQCVLSTSFPVFSSSSCSLPPVPPLLVLARAFLRVLVLPVLARLACDVCVL